RDMTDESVRRYRSCLIIFSEYLAHKGFGLDDVDNEALKDFLKYLRNERNVKHKTVEQYFSALSVLYDYLVFEETVNKNMILPFRKRYLKMYKNNSEYSQRRLLSVEDMSKLVHSILDPRDKAMAIVLAKTGVRRGELLKMDVDDLNWTDYSIALKPVHKRSNKIVFFDDECALVLRRWLKTREKLNPQNKALFISYETLDRLSRNGAYQAVVKYAEKLGFHNSESQKLEDHFGPHCFRHWFTTMLIRKGMQREYVKELRGDTRGEAIDIYRHIDREELRRAYLASVPKLGI
ncbi:tyrosine-type recombinase/integrase, partial [Candidatus Bathyarchaeota archaeon]|nr:tyrosine-type recombinase/integrase [Candidatus Bathyarchaeota archaeon]